MRVKAKESGKKVSKPRKVKTPQLESGDKAWYVDPIQLRLRKITWIEGDLRSHGIYFREGRIAINCLTPPFPLSRRSAAVAFLESLLRDTLKGYQDSYLYFIRNARRYEREIRRLQRKIKSLK